MIPGNSYKTNFLGFPGEESVFVGTGGDDSGDASVDCPEGWWEFAVRDNSFDTTTHRVFKNPALIATVIPKD